LLSVCACRRDDRIETCRVPKGAELAMPMASQASAPIGDAVPEMNVMGAEMGLTAAASPNEIAWKTPKGWVEQAPSAIRLGSFIIKGENGQTADISVVPLSGEAGGDLANINRWRGQIHLPPITPAELTQNSQTISPGGRSMLWVDFVGAEPLMQSRYKKRVMAAIYHRGGRTWFFKMLGEDTTVRQAKSSFMQFLKSLRFNEA